jgi:hypothetical protein
MATKLKIEKRGDEILIVHCSNFICSYMAWSSLTSVLGFCVKFFFFEEIYIFSNGGHLGLRAWLSDIILKGTDPGTIPARLNLIWFSDWPIPTKLWWNGPWMVPFQNYVQ